MELNARGDFVGFLDEVAVLGSAHPEMVVLGPIIATTSTYVVLEPLVGEVLYEHNLEWYEAYQPGAIGPPIDRANTPTGMGPGYGYVPYGIPSTPFQRQ